MTQEKITLKGNKYSGRFIGDIRKIKDWIMRNWSGSKYTEKLGDFYQWGGVGIIKDNQTYKSQKFLFDTEGKRDKIYVGRLEEEIIRIRDELGNEIKNASVVGLKKVTYDLVLGQMYEEAKKRDDEIIPLISPKILNCEELLMEGIIANKKSGGLKLLLYLNNFIR